MKIVKTGPGCNLFLGHQGEKLALRIVFDIGPWLETYGFGTAHLLHQRKGDPEPYPVGTVQEGSEVSWDVSDADTAVEGTGRYELHFYTGESLVKSVTGDTLVRGALRYGEDPPAPVKLWLNHVAAEERKIYQAVTDTEAARDEARTAAGNAAASEQEAAAAAGNAAAAAQAAEAVQKAAGVSAGNAKTSEENAAKSAEEARKAAESGGGKGITVTAKPGQLIVIKEVDENGNPTKWEAVDRTHWVEGGIIHKLDNKYLDLEWLPISTEEIQLAAEKIVTNLCTDNITETEGGFPDLTESDVYDGMPIAVYVNGVRYECTVTEGTAFGTVAMHPDMPLYLVFKSRHTDVAYGNHGASYVASVYAVKFIDNKLPGKFLPEGVPYVESTVYADGEYTSKHSSSFGCFVVAVDGDLEAIPENMSVVFDGVKYDNFNRAEIPGMGTAFGNLSFMNAAMGTDHANTGEPFMVGVSNAGMTFMLLDAESTRHTLTVKINEIVHSLDPKYLPMDEIVTAVLDEIPAAEGGSF